MSGWPPNPYGYPMPQRPEPEEEFVDPRPKYHPKAWRDMWDVILDNMTPDEIRQLINGDMEVADVRAELGLAPAELSNSYRDEEDEEDRWEW